MFSKKRFKVLVMLATVTAVIWGIPVELPAASAASSSWVNVGADGKLVYKTDSLGNRIMDFSSAGYGGGGVAIPEVPTVRTIAPSGGDDTDAIQQEIDLIAAMPLVNGFRGALLLGPGTFNCSKQINIKSSGIVIRGSGSGSEGTVILMNGAPFQLFNLSGSGSHSLSGSVNMTDSFVPSGTDTFAVSNASGFQVGDTVLVTRIATKEWIHYMGMDTLVRDGKPQTWLAEGSKFNTDRIIKSIDGNNITLDAPLTDSFDSNYLGSIVGTVSKYTFPGRISQVGLEQMKIQAPPGVEQYKAVYMNAIIDSWVRDLVIQDGVNNFSVDKTSKRITVDNVIINHTVSSTDAAAPADFTCTGTQILFNKSQTNDLQSGGKGSWSFVTQSQGTGPIVVLNFSSTEKNGIAPHQRWTTGILVDNSKFMNPGNDALGIAYQNRGTSGSGHGWPMGWSVAWNVTAPKLLVSQAPGTMNWCIGCEGSKSSSKDPVGVYDSYGTKVTPVSLYLTQLKERLGQDALTNIGYAPPVLHTPADQTVEATSELTPVEIGAATSDEGVLITNDAPASFPIGKTVVTWTATNQYGITNTSTQWITIADTTPPVIDGAATTQPNANGWYNQDVTVHFNATDSGSGVDKITPDTTLSSEGAEQSLKGEAADKIGNTANFTVGHISIDKTNPVISVAAPEKKAYMTSDNLTVSYAVYDYLSGVERSSSLLDGKLVMNGDKVNLAQAAGSHLLEVTAQDKAGNTITKGVYFDVLIHASVDIKPETLNLKSMGGAESITAEIEFPSDYDISLVNLTTVKMIVNGKTIDAQVKKEDQEDNEDQKKAKDLKIKFDRQKVIAAVGENSGSSVSVTVSGKLIDGREFTGSSTLKVN
jgi:hypothetical protein